MEHKKEIDNFEYIAREFAKKAFSSAFVSEVDAQYVRYDSFILAPLFDEGVGGAIDMDEYIKESIDCDVQKFTPYEEVIRKLSEKYGMKGWQFSPYTYNNITSINAEHKCDLLILMPNIAIDINCIDAEMNSMGYKRGLSFEGIKEDDRWVVVRYSPKEKVCCSLEIRSGTKKLYHLCPKELFVKIQKEGLKPTDVNPGYQDEKRLFFFVSDDRTKVLTDERRSMFRYKALKRRESKCYSGIFFMLEIDPKELPNNINFFLDPQMDGSVFTNDVIPPQCIDFEATRGYRMIREE